MTAPLATHPGSARIWLRKNLFRSWADGVVTVVSAVVLGTAVFRAVRFVVATGRWEIIEANLRLLIVGRFPDVHLPRVSVSLAVVALVTGLVAGIVHRRQVQAGTSAVAHLGVAARTTDLVERFWPVLIGAVLLLLLSSTAGPWITAVGAVAAGVTGRLVGSRLPTFLHPVVVVAAVVTPFALVVYLASAVGWDSWGGLMLNVYLAIASILLCFPLGVLAALGRRSTLPAVRWISTGYIELFRGAPLFVLLLMASQALGFFVPADAAPGRVVRAIVVFTLFTGAYMAEIVRGGLQSLPKGQAEAGRAVGLSPTRVTLHIVLPQALRNVIPAQVGQLISLFKDTTLAGFAMGLFELGNISESITSQGPFRGQQLLPEVVAFVALLFWIGSYTMARESQRLERKLGVGER
jgi:general L-amino acid transport system permease protein